MALDGYITASSEDVFPIFAVRNGVFEMGMTYPFSELADGEFRIFLSAGEGMVRVPEERDVIGGGPLQDIFQHR